MTSLENPISAQFLILLYNYCFLFLSLLISSHCFRTDMQYQSTFLIKRSTYQREHASWCQWRLEFYHSTKSRINSSYSRPPVCEPKVASEFLLFFSVSSYSCVKKKKAGSMSWFKIPFSDRIKTIIIIENVLSHLLQ